MAFLDDISRSISDVSQKAINKGKDVAEITKINSALSDEEKKLRRTYIEIGRLYMSLHAKDGAEEFAAMVEEVKTSEQKISQMKERIAAIRNISKCEKCGAEIPSEALFCNVCGAKKERTAPSTGNVSGQTTTAVCSKCGKPLKAGMRFCTSCGTPVQS